MSGFSLTFLGTGTSVGIPVIGCECPVCQSTDPRNQRTRASVVVTDGDTTILVDTGPDLREQALREKLNCVDAVAYTHAHLDHVVGFDELRAFCWRREDPLPIHATASCMQALFEMFGWAFQPANVQNKGYVRPAPCIIDGSFRIGAFQITPLPVVHAAIETIGLLFECDGARLAYLPDVKHVPETTVALMRGVDVLIVDALRPTSHNTHFSTEEALALVADLRPRQTWLTHLAHENDHATLAAELPPGIGVAHDGLVLRVVRG